MSSFTYKKNEESDFLNIFLEGPINEGFAYFDLKVLSDKTVRFDFSNVTTINSMGIRYWIAWLQSNPDVVFHFRNCPVCIVDQINNVSDFMPKGTTVESFFVPFYSEFTGEEKHELYMLGKEFNKGKVPVIKEIFDSQGSPMEIDIYPQKYFKFLLR